MRYRRAFVSSGSFLFTVVTEDRRPPFGFADAVGLPPQGLLYPTRAIRGEQPLWQHRYSEPRLRNETDLTRPAVD